MKIADKKTDLRRGVDHIGAGASFVIHDGAGRILLHKRSQKCRDEQGKWCNGGGAIEFGETIEEAVRREIKEEVGADVLEMEFLTVYDSLRDNNGTPTHWIQVIYTAKVDPAQVRIADKEKIDEIGWFTSSTLPEPRHSNFDKSFQPARKAGFVK